MTKHRLVVTDLAIRRTRKRRVVNGLPTIRWGALTKDKAQELREKLLDGGLEE